MVYVLPEQGKADALAPRDASLRALGDDLGTYDATRRRLAHRLEAYSPECVEGKFANFAYHDFCEFRRDGVLGSPRAWSRTLRNS